MASPRVLIVSRRTVRKNKFIDFVGEYHLDLIVANGATPVIVPRVSGIDNLLESFEPIDGVLLCEGEDIGPSLFPCSSSALSQADLDEIRRLHPDDAAASDPSKDSIELRLTRLCLSRSIPFLGICRGSQLLNLACGGTLYADVETEISKEAGSAKAAVKHINYGDYDGHRHRISLVEGTPLYFLFDEAPEVEVNSYHHQGVKKLAERFVPMAFAGDGLIEGFFDPRVYDPDQGKFLMGLQFHPERMRNSSRPDEFDHVGCPRIYQEFVKAVTAYHRKNVKSSNFQPITKFVELSTELSSTEKTEEKLRSAMEKKSEEQLNGLLFLYQKMGEICSDVLERMP